jgi:putative ABC transport system substrate-binding protein
VKRREFITLLGGAATAWPVAARGQQSAMPVIGLIDAASAADRTDVMAAFREGLADAGTSKGRTLRSNIAGRKANLIAYRSWRPISFAAE